MPFQNALKEINGCQKTGDWIWYIIPSKLPSDKQNDGHEYSDLSKKFCINCTHNHNDSGLKVSHYLMIPFLKQNYETIINAIHKCLITKKTPINQLFQNGADIPKFTSSITEFLAGYNTLQNKIADDEEFIKKLKTLSRKKYLINTNILKTNENENLGFGLFNGGSNQSSTTTQKLTKKSQKPSHPQNSNKKLTKRKLPFAK